MGRHFMAEQLPAASWVSDVPDASNNVRENAVMKSNRKNLREYMFNPPLEPCLQKPATSSGLSVDFTGGLSLTKPPGWNNRLVSSLIESTELRNSFGASINTKTTSLFFVAGRR